jgi:hypothetical protein
MTYPDPKFAEEFRKRHGMEPPNPHVIMGPPLKVDPVTGKLRVKSGAEMEAERLVAEAKSKAKR